MRDRDDEHGLWARVRAKLSARVFGASFLTLGIVVVARPERLKLRADPLLLDDAATLTELEDRGLSFARVVGSERLRAIARVVESDMAELTNGQSEDSPRRPFKPGWLSRGRFDFVGVVNRIDRRRFDPSSCGEVRLVYRLAIKNRRRPPTRLPMTVNVRIPQPRPASDASCNNVAARWLARDDVTALLATLPPPAQIEINFQSIHTPGAAKDMDDSAEYVLRSFEVDDRSLRVDGLFNTPRADLGKRELVAWIASNLREIDDGSAVLPKNFLAGRIVSVSPRGLVHPQNRPFSTLLSADDLAGLPLAALGLARTPELLLRRLDESTCSGCHQTRGVAGFHLLGEDRGDASFNTLAVGHSPHLGADLGWRASDLASAARGERGAPRPFATYPTGQLGSDCGLVPGLSSWACRPRPRLSGHPSRGRRRLRAARWERARRSLRGRLDRAKLTRRRTARHRDAGGHDLPTTDGRATSGQVLRTELARLHRRCMQRALRADRRTT